MPQLTRLPPTTWARSTTATVLSGSRRLDGRPLPAGAAAQDHDVVVRHLLPARKRHSTRPGRVPGAVDLRLSCTRKPSSPPWPGPCPSRGCSSRSPSFPSPPRTSGSPTCASSGSPPSWGRRCSSCTCGAHPRAARPRRRGLRVVHRPARGALRDLGRDPPRGRPRGDARARTPRSSASARCSPRSSGRPAPRCSSSGPCCRRTASGSTSPTPSSSSSSSSRTSAAA